MRYISWNEEAMWEIEMTVGMLLALMPTYLMNDSLRRKSCLVVVDDWLQEMDSSTFQKDEAVILFYYNTPLLKYFDY